ncbi:hypothetical protein [Ruegeria profundi]|uniref:hypothetical protein n=1 Tax=Ruegeria profundi TaxID=1685378 RepID=UPI001CD3D76A|nr:hypothetical protein [Ruegeria profundi]MCA0928926.1 hypothetical protein [Ruegeria profundi]
MSPYSFTRNNRTRRGVLTLIGIYAGLLALVIVFDAAWWLVVLLGLTTLPALWDIIQDTQAGLTLDTDRIRWFSGNREGEVALSDIDHVRLDTRWDFSVRSALVLTSDKRIRLPDEAMPPHKELEAVLQKAGLRVERHHFRVF